MLSLLVTEASRTQGAKQCRLTRQRVELHDKEDIEYLGNFTQFEVDLRCQRFPDVTIKFQHYPRTPKELKQERHKNYRCLSQVDLDQRGVLIGKGRMPPPDQVGNIRMTKPVGSNLDAYYVIKGNTNQAKQKGVLCLIEDDYWFVIHWNPIGIRDDVQYVETSLELATKKVQNAMNH